MLLTSPSSQLAGVRACVVWLWPRREVKEIDAEFSSSMNRAYERFGMMGERVLGFAYRQVRFSSLPSARLTGSPATLARRTRASRLGSRARDGLSFNR